MDILKLGGSVITQKKLIKQPSIQNIDLICSRISQSGNRDLILVLGAGSYGHPLVSMGDDLVSTHESVVELAQLFASRLRAHGMKCGVISPFQSLYISGKRIHGHAHLIASRMLNAGYIPILHGDSIWGDKGLEVISGDRICSYLASKLHPRRVGFLTDVEGILLEGNVVASISWFQLRSRLGEIGGSQSQDVTMGMKGKALEAIRIACMGIPCCIFGMDGLVEFLQGKLPGTVIR